MWEQLEQGLKQGPEQALDQLITYLEQSGDPHQLFDARLMKWKFSQQLPLLNPTSLANVPGELKSEFEQIYVAAGLETGQLLLKRGQFADAWMYFRAIGERAPMVEALETYRAPAEIDESFEEVLQLALYQGIHPSKGVALMLASHGMCNTVTAVDQVFLEMKPEDRSKTAEILVKQLYEDLQQNVRYEVEQRIPMLQPDLSLSELLAGRSWLFENDNYHTDVSHLNAVVRFARALADDQDEALGKAIQLCEYGARLSPHLQYPGEPPFDDYYNAHLHYFRIIADREREASLQFFRDRMAEATEPQDRELISYVLVDLLMRLKRYEEAVAVAEEHLKNVHEQSGFSFVTLCEDTGDMSALKRHAEAKQDPVLYIAAALTKPEST
ncbi:MAG: hypothetical protein KDA78_20235 [Planctomycetaceae bacterium]|nr:hypothetical protein [Planctomycetaceae bacterium]